LAHSSQSMAAYCLPVEQLAGRLESVGCPRSTQFVIAVCHDMLSGLERQRPAWAGVLQGMRGALPRDQTLALVRRGLIDNQWLALEKGLCALRQAGAPSAQLHRAVCQSRHASTSWFPCTCAHACLDV
jgi:hypothetical protein